ncbi:hypothetical protein K4X33_12485 [Brevibacterium casei]|nr:hypothetical protein K4X33_12485 [Brevibacterium casei]
MDSPHTSTNRQPGGGEQPGGAGTPETSTRQPRVQSAAGFFSGPAELLEFVLPLATAQILGATPAQTGALLAVQFLVSLLVRPVAGVLVDRAGSERGTLLLAAAGAGCGALSFGLYAAATTVPRPSPPLVSAASAARTSGWRSAPTSPHASTPETTASPHLWGSSQLRV